MLRLRSPRIKTERLILRMPEMKDFDAWLKVRHQSEAFLAPWEPVRSTEYLSLKGYRNRIHWGRRAYRENRGLPLFLIRRQDGQILGGINLDNVQQGVSKSCTVGYWMGEPFAGLGYMGEALPAVVEFAFERMDISRVQAGTLPENRASRGLLVKSGFHEEGLAQAYLQIAGKWRDHVLYSRLAPDRTDPTNS